MYSVVIPVYNGAKTVTALAEGITDLFSHLGTSFQMVFVDDHSEDNSWDIIRGLAEADTRITAIRLVANYGQHNATVCGLNYVSGDFIITMDDDLQHSPVDIPKLIRKMEETGADVVIARLVNKKHNWRRRAASNLMRRLNELFAKKPKGLHLSSFRLMKRVITDKMLCTEMSFIFIPVLIFGVTRNVVNTEVEHRKRQYGSSNYSFCKMAGLAARLFINANPVLWPIFDKKQPGYVVAEQVGSMERRKKVKGKVLVLGGGLLQVPLLKMARDRGCEVHLSDYSENPPGLALTDEFIQTSTFSLEENLRYAGEKGMNCIMTVGTDQPVYTAAFVSEKLGLWHPITAGQGLSVTNKQYMKEIMAGSGIPSPNFRVLREKGDLSSFGLEFPVVLKPVDSQGQRGVFLLNGREDTDTIARYFDESLGYSRTGKVILEEYYKGTEITVNCWVKGGRAYPLMITDRLHFDDSVALGICKQQRFPARGTGGYEQELDRIINSLADAFKIREGPLYVQAVTGSEGIKIIEFGYRIGGGFESEIIPRVTGIDILDLYFTLVAEGSNTFEPDLAAQKVAMGSIFFMLARPGVISRIIVPEEFAGCGRLFVNSGDVIGTIENATSRIGCFAFYTNSQLEYNNMLDRFDSHTAILDENNTDILIHGIWE